MPIQQTIPTIIAVGKISGALAMQDTDQQRLLRSSTMNGELFIQITIVTDFLEQEYFLYPDEPTLRPVANYLWWLCGRYTFQALTILGQGGTEVVFNNNGAVVNVRWQKVQVVIGYPDQAVPAGSPTPNAGDTTITLPYAIMPLSEVVTLGGTVMKIYPSNDNNYLTTYGAASTLYVFRDPFQQGTGLEFEFAEIISISQGGSGGGGGTGQPALQAIVITSAFDTNTLTLAVLGTFVYLIKGSFSYDRSTITQTGNQLDLTPIGGLYVGDEVTVIYYP